MNKLIIFNNNFLRILAFWLPVVVWASIIFMFSTIQVEKSDRFDLTDFIIKKSAHLVEYVMLFVLFYRAVKNTTSASIQKAAITAIIAVIIYGASDEFHQSFTPGRGPALRDVIIDTTGGFIAWFGIWKLLPKAPEKLKKLAKILQII